MESLSQLVQFITKKDGAGVVYVFKTVNPKSLNVIDLAFIDNQLQYQLSSSLSKHREVIRQILNAYVQLNKSLSTSYDVTAHFEDYSELVKYFNRFAETQTVWIIEPLIYLTRILINYAIKADNFISKNPNHHSNFESNIGDLEVESCLIKTSRIVHNSFKLCLNDRNDKPNTSRKSQIYFFVGLELKIYFKLQNRDLAKNMEKVLISKQKELPDLDQISKSQAITYLYYSGATSCGNTDYNTAYLKFQKAFQLCSKTDIKHKQAILFYLIPLKFLATNKLINLKVLWSQFPVIANIYRDLVASLERGDIKLFDSFFTKFEDLFLSKNLFIVIENIRSFILLRLIKNVYRFNQSNSHLPIALVTRAIEFSKYHTHDASSAGKNINIFSSDETECLIANLIFKGDVKGYLSHTNGILVLSKKDPFPKHVRIDDEKP